MRGLSESPACRAQLGSRQCGAGHSPSGHMPGCGDAKTGLSRTKAPHKVPVAKAPHSAQHTRTRQRGLSQQMSTSAHCVHQEPFPIHGKGPGASSEQGVGGHCRANVWGSPPTEAHRQATREFRWESPQAQAHAPPVQLNRAKSRRLTVCAGVENEPPPKGVHAARGRGRGRQAPQAAAARRLCRVATPVSYVHDRSCTWVGPWSRTFSKHPVRQRIGQSSHLWSVTC